MATQQDFDTLNAKIATLEQFNLARAMPDPRGSEYTERIMAQVLLAMEALVVTLKNDSRFQCTQSMIQSTET